MPEPTSRKPTATAHANALFLSAGRVCSLESVAKDPHSIGKQSASSVHLVKAFLNDHSEVANDFLARAGTSAHALIHALDLPREPESQPEPSRLPDNPTDEQREFYEAKQRFEKQRDLDGLPAPFTRPVMEARQLAMTKAVEKGAGNFGLGAVLASLFETPSSARTALIEAADLAKVTVALTWLENQPDPDKAEDMMSAIKAHTRAILDLTWPTIRSDGELKSGAKLRDARDKHYEAHPDQYEKPLPIAERLAKHPVNPTQDYIWRAGVCLHAAQNEARIRRAPECTLDHLFVALLQDGTDTSALLDRHGVDRSAWVTRLNESLPRYEAGPRWPPHDRALGMSVPSNVSYEFKPLPEGTRLEDLTPEQRKEVVTKIVDLEKRFTDLALLRNVFDEPKTIAHSLLLEAGIS